MRLFAVLYGFEDAFGKVRLVLPHFLEDIRRLAGIPVVDETLQLVVRAPQDGNLRLLGIRGREGVVLLCEQRVALDEDGELLETVGVAREGTERSGEVVVFARAPEVMVDGDGQGLYGRRRDPLVDDAFHEVPGTLFALERQVRRWCHDRWWGVGTVVVCGTRVYLNSAVYGGVVGRWISRVMGRRCLGRTSGKLSNVDFEIG